MLLANKVHIQGMTAQQEPQCKFLHTTIPNVASAVSCCLSRVVVRPFTLWFLLVQLVSQYRMTFLLCALSNISVEDRYTTQTILKPSGRL